MTENKTKKGKNGFHVKGLFSCTSFFDQHQGRSASDWEKEEEEKCLQESVKNKDIDL